MQYERIQSLELNFFNRNFRPGRKFGPMPVAKTRTMKPLKGIPAYFASFWDIPLLSREQEHYLFVKFNYLKWSAHRLRAQLGQQPSRKQMNEIEALWRQALNIRNYIVSANLRLVVSISKKFVRLDSDFFNLVAEGNVKLIRAVELFDFRRNVKFSTYAYAAIQNKFRHLCAVRALEASRVWPENNFAEVLDHRADNYVSEANRKHNAEQIKELFRQIPEREQEVLRLRYGLDTYEEQTLAQVGQTLGVTKERVRQLEARAFIRFKRFAVA